MAGKLPKTLMNLSNVMEFDEKATEMATKEDLLKVDHYKTLVSNLMHAHIVVEILNRIQYKSNGVVFPRAPLTVSAKFQKLQNMDKYYQHITAQSYGNYYGNGNFLSTATDKQCKDTHEAMAKVLKEEFYNQENNMDFIKTIKKQFEGIQGDAASQVKSVAGVLKIVESKCIESAAEHVSKNIMEAQTQASKSAKEESVKPVPTNK